METDHKKNNTQLYWGAALILMGIAVIVKMFQVMPNIAELSQSDTKLWLSCGGLSLMSIILIGGGIKKVIDYYKPDDKEAKDISANDEDV